MSPIPAVSTGGELEAIKRDISFLAQMIKLEGIGLASVNEHGRLTEISERYSRWNDTPTEKGTQWYN